MINESIWRVSEGHESLIYELYNKDWFVQVWNNSDSQLSNDSDHTLRDEFALALFECCLVIVGENRHEWNSLFKESWVKVAFEIADVCFKVLDWKDNQA